MERLETTKKKEKKAKLKKEVEKLKKENKLSSKKLSKHQENQALLVAVKEKREEKEDIVEQSLEKRRSFICSCGCKVTLEGETYNRKIKDGFELCSSCSY